MKFITDYIVEEFILNSEWEDFPQNVRDRAIVCSIDLITALSAGSRSRQFEVGKRIARTVCGTGDIPAVGTDMTFNFYGAVIAMAHSANSFDIDDGHNLIKGHPGASFIAGVLAAALEKNITYREYLTALVVSYELTVRGGLAIQKHYNYYHNSGTYGAFGTAAGTGRVCGFSREQLNTALSIAEFHAPLVPVMRSVEYPSMNKDGVPFGLMVGVMAVLETMAGATGYGYLLEMPEFRPMIDRLGKDYEILNLYFKPYPTCRWAQQPIRACIEVKKAHGFTHEQVKCVTVRTFEAAARLSKIIPKTTDEAQYNIAYPVACAIVHGDVGIEQVIDENLNDACITDLMSRLFFIVDTKLEAAFPAKRQARVEIELKNGQILRSGAYEAPGEASDMVDNKWVCDKFTRLTGFMYNEDKQMRILDVLNGPLNVRMRDIVRVINN